MAPKQRATSVKMFKLHVICAIFLFALLSWSNAQPVKDQEVEDLIYKLQQLKQLNDGKYLENVLCVKFCPRPKSLVTCPKFKKQNQHDVHKSSICPLSSHTVHCNGHVLSQLSKCAMCFHQRRKRTVAFNLANSNRHRTVVGSVCAVSAW